MHDQQNQPTHTFHANEFVRRFIARPSALPLPGQPLNQG
jgi:hypothetical protein